MGSHSTTKAVRRTNIVTKRLDGRVAGVDGRRKEMNFGIWWKKGSRVFHGCRGEAGWADDCRVRSLGRGGGYGGSEGFCGAWGLRDGSSDGVDGPIDLGGEGDSGSGLGASEADAGLPARRRDL